VAKGVPVTAPGHRDSLVFIRPREGPWKRDQMKKFGTTQWRNAGCITVAFGSGGGPGGLAPSGSPSVLNPRPLALGDRTIPGRGAPALGTKKTGAFASPMTFKTFSETFFQKETKR
jgi:hypothetical protein